MINDQGEIDDKSSKHSTRSNTRASNNSFQAGGQFVSDNNGGPGGFLAPTHIQRRIVTSPGVSSTADNRQSYQRSSSQLDSRSASRPEFNRQQTFPETTNHDIQPWVNPYWPKTDQNSSNQATTNANGPQKSPSKNGTWKNPYWPEKNTTDQQQGSTWKNPYWPEKNATNQKTDSSSLRKSSSGGHSIVKVPSFYRRVYPSESASTLASSPTPSSQKKSKKKHSHSVISQNITDTDELPFTVDKQSVAHYRSSSKISVNINRSTKQPPTPTPSQKSKSGAAATVPSPTPSSSSSNFTLKKKPPRKSSKPTNNALPPLLSTSAYSSLDTSSAPILTEGDINSIHDALKLLETNSKNIPVVETRDNNNTPTNTNYQNKTISNLVTPLPGKQDQSSNRKFTPEPRASAGFDSICPGNQQPPPPAQASTGLGSLFSGNQNQQPAQAPSGLGSLFSGNQNQQPAQAPSGLGSLFSGNQNQQPPPPTQSSSGFGSLFSGNQNQQPPPPTQSSSGFGSLFSGNQNQQPPAPTQSPSGFGSLFSGNQNQQQPQTLLSFNSGSTTQFSGNSGGQEQVPPFSTSGQVLYFDAKSFPSNNDSKPAASSLPVVFSAPSYPFNMNDNLTTKGPIVLI